MRKVRELILSIGVGSEGAPCTKYVVDILAPRPVYHIRIGLIVAPLCISPSAFGKSFIYGD